MWFWGIALLLSLRGCVRRLLRFWYFRVGKIRERVAPEVVVEPGEIVLHDGTLGARLGDAVAVALIHNHFNLDAAILQPLAQLVGVGDRHAFVIFAVLD